jgi:predicted P-loop ATPase
MDYVVILAGKGGVGKTTLFQKLAMRSEWVKEITEGLDRSKDARMALSRGWIVEASEGVAFDLASAGGMKSIITDTCDEFRPPYATGLQRFPRQTVIVASTNDETLLKYEAGSGNRRFLPLTMRGRADFITLEAEVEQVWGEAAVRAAAGEREWEPAAAGAPDLETLAESEVAAHTEVDPWCDDLDRFLSDPTHLHGRPWCGLSGLAVSSYDLLTLALRLDPDKKIAAHGKRLRRAMQALGGWQHVTINYRDGAGPLGTRKFTGYWKPDH